MHCVVLRAPLFIFSKNTSHPDTRASHPVSSSRFLDLRLSTLVLFNRFRSPSRQRVIRLPSKRLTRFNDKLNWLQSTSRGSVIDFSSAYIHPPVSSLPPSDDLQPTKYRPPSRRIIRPNPIARRPQRSGCTSCYVAQIPETNKRTTRPCKPSVIPAYPRRDLEPLAAARPRSVRRRPLRPLVSSCVCCCLVEEGPIIWQTA